MFALTYEENDEVLNQVQDQRVALFYNTLNDTIIPHDLDCAIT
jgi:hypothetical protein